MTTAAERQALIDDTCARLLDARARQVPAEAPVLPDAEMAYAVQEAMGAALGWFADGPARHWKSGGASRDVALTHAPLPPAGVWASPAEARGWPGRHRGIEAEIALRLGTPVDAALAATLTPERAGALVDAMTVSIELVDSRWAAAFAAPNLARLADLQSHGALVLGPWRPYDASHDWATQVCRVRVGDAAEQVFIGSHSLRDPAWVLPAWLRHATRAGAVMPAGAVVTTGTWCGLLHGAPGDLVTVRFDGIGEAQLQL